MYYYFLLQRHPPCLPVLLSLCRVAKGGWGELPECDIQARLRLQYPLPPFPILNLHNCLIFFSPPPCLRTKACVLTARAVLLLPFLFSSLCSVLLLGACPFFLLSGPFASRRFSGCPAVCCFYVICFQSPLSEFSLAPSCYSLLLPFRLLLPC